MSELKAGDRLKVVKTVGPWSRGEYLTVVDSVFTRASGYCVSVKDRLGNIEQIDRKYLGTRYKKVRSNVTEKKEFKVGDVVMLTAHYWHSFTEPWLAGDLFVLESTNSPPTQPGTVAVQLPTDMNCIYWLPANQLESLGPLDPGVKKEFKVGRLEPEVNQNYVFNAGDKVQLLEKHGDYGATFEGTVRKTFDPRRDTSVVVGTGYPAIGGGQIEVPPEKLKNLTRSTPTSKLCAGTRVLAYSTNWPGTTEYWDPSLQAWWVKLDNGSHVSVRENDLQEAPPRPTELLKKPPEKREKHLATGAAVMEAAGEYQDTSSETLQVGDEVEVVHTYYSAALPLGLRGKVVKVPDGVNDRTVRVDLPSLGLRWLRRECFKKVTSEKCACPLSVPLCPHEKEAGFTVPLESKKMPSNTKEGTYTFTTGSKEQVVTLTLTPYQRCLLQETVEKVKVLKQEEVQDLMDLEQVLRSAK